MPLQGQGVSRGAGRGPDPFPKPSSLQLRTQADKTQGRPRGPTPVTGPRVPGPSLPQILLGQAPLGPLTQSFPLPAPAAPQTPTLPLIPGASFQAPLTGRPSPCWPPSPAARSRRAPQTGKFLATPPTAALTCTAQPHTRGGPGVPDPLEPAGM